MAAVSELLSVYLELIAAKAKQLATDVKLGRTWPGDVRHGLSEIRAALEKASEVARDDR